MKLKEIRKTVEQVMDVKDMTIKSRKRHLVYSRYFYFSLSKKYTKQSLYSIGFEIGKDHSTVVHGLKVFEDVITVDPFYFELYKKCLKILDSLDTFDEIEHLEITEQELKDFYNSRTLQLEEKYENKLNKLKTKIHLLGDDVFENLTKLNQEEIKDLKFRIDVFFKSRLLKKGTYKAPSQT